jgi:hypothetical protein
MVAVLAPLPALPAQVDMAVGEIWAHSASEDLLVLQSSRAKLAIPRDRRHIGDMYLRQSHRAAVAHYWEAAAS